MAKGRGLTEQEIERLCASPALADYFETAMGRMTEGERLARARARCS